MASGLAGGIGKSLLSEKVKRNENNGCSLIQLLTIKHSSNVSSSGLLSLDFGRIFFGDGGH